MGSDSFFLLLCNETSWSSSGVIKFKDKGLSIILWSYYLRVRTHRTSANLFHMYAWASVHLWRNPYFSSWHFFVLFQNRFTENWILEPIKICYISSLIFLIFLWEFHHFLKANTASSPQTSLTQTSTRMLTTRAPLQLHWIVLVKYCASMHIFHTFCYFLLDSFQYLTVLWSMNAQTECISSIMVSSVP